MLFSKNSKVIIFTGLLILFTGVGILIGRAFSIQVIQTLFPRYFYLKLNAALCFILSASALLTTQIRFKKHTSTVFILLSILITLAGGIAIYNQPFNTVNNITIDLLVLATVGLLIWSLESRLKETDRQQHNNEDKLKALNDQLKNNTEAKSIELIDLLDKLKKCAGSYHALIEQASDAIYVVDAYGAFIEVNSSLCNMTGYTRDELLKLNVTDLIDPEQLKTDPFVNILEVRDHAMIKERRFVRKDGEMFEAEVNVKMFAENRLLAIAHDITRRKQLEAELREAKLKFKTLAEKSSVGVYIIQKEKLLYVNSRYAEIFGYKPYELININESFIDLIISDGCREIVRANIEARYRGDIDFANYEVTGRKKDGTFNHIEFSGSRAVINGEPTIIGTMVDITERWHTEDILKRAEANLQTIMDTTDTAYALLDNELKITAFNQLAGVFASRQYYHMLKIGDQLKDYLPPERLSHFLALVNDVLKGNPVNYEINYPQADDSLFWYHIRLFPVINSDDKILGLMAAISDITERKNAEDNLQTAYKRIHDHISSIKNMAWKQSHLIRSPLANLKGLTALLQDDHLDNEILKNIRIELERLDKVIMELADDASNHEL